MVRASKNIASKGFHTYAEKKRTSFGSVNQALGADSGLPFCHCPLSLSPCIEPVVSPSGHVYEREVILEYILTKSAELKDQTRLYEIQESKNNQELLKITNSSLSNSIENQKDFISRQDSIANDSIIKPSYLNDDRSKRIDDTTNEEKLSQLSKANPFLPRFQPVAAPDKIKQPMKRPPSPMTKKPLRAKDLIPMKISKDTKDANDSKYICPVTSKTINTQSIVFIKTTGIPMLESAYKDLNIGKSLVCPITNKKFQSGDVIKLKRSITGYAAGDKLIAKKWKAGLN